jgi:hypothetical protein
MHLSYLPNQLLDYADDVNSLRKNTNTIKSTENLVYGSMEVGLEVNT